MGGRRSCMSMLGVARRREVAVGLAVALVSSLLAVVPPAVLAQGPSSASPTASASPSAGPSGGTAPTNLPLAASGAATALSYQASGYRYQVVGAGGPPSGWQSTIFDDSSWTVGSAAFGSGASCPVASTVQTAWPVGTQILLRHPVTLPAGTTAVTVYFGADNGATVYWNGTQIGSQSGGGCASQNQYSLAVPAGSFTAGAGNLLAVLGTDDGVSDDFLDLSVVATVPSGPGAAESYGTGSGRFGPRWVARRAEPVNTATGNYDTQANDLTMPGRGVPFSFTRAYNSLDAAVGPFGPGWSFSYGTRLVLDGSGNAVFVADDGAEYPFASNGSGGFVTPAGATSTLAAVSGGYRLTRHDRVAYRFDASGNLVAEADANGNTVSLGYTGGLLTSITDTAGRVVTVAHDAAGHISGLTDPIGRTVTYSYNASGQLASVTDVRGGTTGYTYDATGRLAAIVDQNGHTVVANTYDPVSGRVTGQKDALGDATAFAWNAATTTSTMTDARGGVWTDVYSNGLLASSTDPLGHVTSYTYDAGFNVASVTDANGRTTTLTHDAAGDVLTRTAPSPLSYAESFTYDAANDLLTSTDGRGNTTTYTYDGAGNLTKTSFADGASASATYDAQGQRLSSTDRRGNTTAYSYDANGDLTSISSPLGERTTFTFDVAGRRLTEVDPRGNATGANPSQYTSSFAYDAADNLVAITDALGHVTRASFDPAGNQVGVTDQNGHTTEYSYDAADHLTSATDPLNDVTRYAYDATGDLVTRTDANQHARPTPTTSRAA